MPWEVTVPDERETGARAAVEMGLPTAAAYRAGFDAASRQLEGRLQEAEARAVVDDAAIETLREIGEYAHRGHTDTDGVVDILRHCSETFESCEYPICQKVRAALRGGHGA